MQDDVSFRTRNYATEKPEFLRDFHSIPLEQLGIPENELEWFKKWRKMQQLRLDDLNFACNKNGIKNDSSGK